MEVAIYLQGGRGAATVDAMVDSASQSPTVTLYPDDSRKLLENRTDRIVIPAGKTLNVVLRRAGTDSLSSIVYRIFPYRVNRAPEHGPATLTLGAIRSDEDLDTSADIDEYTLAGLEGKDLVAYLAMIDSANPGNFALQFANTTFPEGAVQGGVNAPPYGTLLEDNATNNFVVPSFDAWAVRVTSSALNHPRYQFLVRQVNHAPEAASATLGPNALVAEAIDYTGDVDEFIIHATPGQLVDVILEGVTPGLLHNLWTFGAGVQERSAALGGAPFYATTGSLTVPASGDIGLRVSSSDRESEGHGRGAYRLRVVPLSTAPETAGTTVTAGDSIMSEQIDKWADTDEFTLIWPVAGIASLVLRCDNGSLGPLRLDLLNSTGAVLRTVAQWGGTAIGSGRFALAAGTYRLRVSGMDPNGAPSAFTGPYRVYAYRVSEAPESSPVTLGLGAIVNDAINPVGDRDTFALAIPPGELFQLRFTATDPAAAGFVAIFDAPDGGQFPGSGTFWMSPRSLTPPIVAVADDRRLLSVSDFVEAGDAHGAYTLEVEPVNTAPESSPATIATGGLLNESIVPNDVDQFDLIGAPNSEIELLVKPWTDYLCAEVLAPDSPARLGATWSQDQDIGSGIIRLGPTGRARIRVWAIPQCLEEVKYRSSLSFAGGYTLEVLAINRAPEIVPAAIAAADTIRGENLSHPADIDEFRFSGTAGQQVLPAFFTVNTQFLTATLSLELLAPNGSTIATVVTNGQYGGWIRGNSLVLPSTGTYTVRMMTEQNLQGRGPYEFTVQP